MTTKELLKKYQEHKRVVKYCDQKIAAGDASEEDLRIVREANAFACSSIERDVVRLTDPTEQLLIRLRYFEGYSWTKIGFTMHYSKTQLQRIHKRALEHLEQGGVVVK